MASRDTDQPRRKQSQAMSVFFVGHKRKNRPRNHRGARNDCSSALGAAVTLAKACSSPPGSHCGIQSLLNLASCLDVHEKMDTDIYIYIYIYIPKIPFVSPMG